MSIPENTLAEIRTAAAAASEMLAEHIVGLDVGERLGVADAFLLAAAPTERQVLSIVDEIEDVGCCSITATLSSTSNMKKSVSTTLSSASLTGRPSSICN